MPFAPPPLRVVELHKRYGTLRALDGVSMEVPAGSIYGFLGLNGAGKTTTLECSLGLLRADSGESHVLGYPSSRIHEARGRIGVVFDAANLHGHLSVLANLEICRHYVNLREGRGPREALRLVGLDSVPDRKARKLSFGMSRRLAIARALLGRPELVIMDEPLSGLDTEGVDTVLDIIRRLNREDGTTFVLCSHRLHEMQTICRHVGLIHAGRLVAQGPLAELLESEKTVLRLRAQPLEEVAAFLAHHPAVESTTSSGDGTLFTRLRDGGGARLNAELVGQGFAVSEITPVRTSLDEYFRRRTRAGGEAPQGASLSETAAHGMAPANVPENQKGGTA
ncbi:MAG: ABC transporter ATP-binding protein [Planctomycetota bacterium]